MVNYGFKRFLFAFLALALILALSATGCAGGEKEKIPYTLTLTSEGGLPLADVVINVYEDESLQKLIWASTTDGDGAISFTAVEDGKYCAVLKEAPRGYKADSFYPLSGADTTVALPCELLPAESLEDTSFSLGDVFLDCEITDHKGEEYKLSELLKVKKAVVLNFWFINCGPCRMEFPYLETAFAKYSEDVALIAVNPVDGTDDKISAFAKDNVLTFPMACGDPEWEKAMALTAYPTTVVIDRYGTVAMIHNGSITEEGEFEKIFEFFTSEDYKQTTVRSVSDIETQ